MARLRDKNEAPLGPAHGRTAGPQRGAKEGGGRGAHTAPFHFRKTEEQTNFVQATRREVPLAGGGGGDDVTGGGQWGAVEALQISIPRPRCWPRRDVDFVKVNLEFVLFLCVC